MNTDYHLVLVDAGPNRLEVTHRVRRLLNIPIHQARDFVGEGNLILVEGNAFTLLSLSDELKDIATTTDLRPKL